MHFAVLAALRLMTFNVNYANPDRQAAIATIAAADADVVLLQEITTEWKRALVAGLDQQYPHRLFHIHTRGAGGIAVLSKLPIREEQILASPEHGWFPAQRLVVDTDFGALQVLNVHLRPAIDRGSWVRGFMTTPPLRLREIETYWKHMSMDMPTVVAGDFNEDSYGSALAFLADRKLSRVVTTGLSTWRYEDLLRMDIDHVVIDDTLTAHDPHVIDGGASDHRPVVVTLRPRAR